MPHLDPDRLVPADMRQLAEADAARAAAREVNAQMMHALGRLVGGFTPWLIEFGSWIFAGLIAFILFVLASLITVGPVDRAVLVATVAFALALPVNLAGLFILRLIQDMQRIGFAGQVARSFHEAGLPTEEPDAAMPEQQAPQHHRTNVVLLYALIILVVSALLTLAGIVAALWHMAWWIAVAFLVMLVLCLVLVIIALFTIRPPGSPAQRARYQRYWDTLVAHAREEQSRQRQGSA
jgi:amino acid transporter